MDKTLIERGTFLLKRIEYMNLRIKQIASPTKSNGIRWFSVFSDTMMSGEFDAIQELVLKYMEKDKKELTKQFEEL